MTVYVNALGTLMKDRSEAVCNASVVFHEEVYDKKRDIQARPKDLEALWSHYK